LNILIARRMGFTEARAGLAGEFDLVNGRERERLTGTTEDEVVFGCDHGYTFV
jgi:hypothetical protein